MLDLTAATLALRNRALSLTVCTTGFVALAQTATGFTRTDGSFVDDGFKVGMEVTPFGFLADTVGVITAVTALTMTVTGTRTPEAASGFRALSVGLPAMRGFENLTLDPTSGRPYLTESMVPATQTLLTTCAQGGTVEETGIYTLTWYGLQNTGIGALRASVDALRALFTPGTTLTAGTATLRIGANPGPYVGQMLPVDGGWMAVTLTIPWRAWTHNTVAA